MQSAGKTLVHVLERRGGSRIDGLSKAVEGDDDNRSQVSLQCDATLTLLQTDFVQSMLEEIRCRPTGVSLPVSHDRVQRHGSLGVEKEGKAEPG